jgi:hypothetical protein
MHAAAVHRLWVAAADALRHVEVVNVLQGRDIEQSGDFVLFYEHQQVHLHVAMAVQQMGCCLLSSCCSCEHPMLGQHW